MDNTFGEILREQVEAAGIKESELANVLGYDPTYISKWMNGSKLPVRWDFSNTSLFMSFCQISRFFVLQYFIRQCYPQCVRVSSAYSSTNTSFPIPRAMERISLPGQPLNLYDSN